MERSAYAKINLYLDVTGKRPDGYHDIASVMQSVSLHDTVTLDAVRSMSPSVHMTCSLRFLPTDSRNLAVRAAETFMAKTGISADVKIHIVKRIPVAAGMAGGSTDCAAVLRMMNDTFGRPLSVDELCALGKGLGADVPFCIRGGCAVTRGIGDVIEPCEPMMRAPILIVKMKERISTAEAYAKIDTLKRTDAPPLSALTDAIAAGRLEGVAKAFYNVFESALPEWSHVPEVKKALADTGAVGVLMSGSGPTVFAAYHKRGDAKAATAAMEKLGYASVIAYPTQPEE